MKLQYKVTLLVFVILAVIGLLGGFFIIRLSQQRVASQSREFGLTLAETIRIVLDRDMQAADRERIQESLTRVTGSNLIDRVVILSNTQRVYASSESSEIGETQNCQEIDQVLGSGNPVIRADCDHSQLQFCVVAPIWNKPECHSCHGSEVGILGAIEVDIDKEPSSALINEQTLLTVLIGGLTLLVLGGALAYMLRFAVVKPLSARLAEAINEREQQEKLYLTDRLASIGEMASGIAHELNNPLTSVIGFSELLMEKDIPDDIKEDLGIVRDESQRAAGIVKSLLTFARRHAPAKQLCQINNALEEILKLRAYEQRVNNIQVNTRLDTKLPESVADYFQLEQVFLNIIINAEAAMIEAHNRGTLTITSQKVDSAIKVSFADDGPGIAKENLNQIFHPFFTTKDVGKGTGLGLSICYGIVAEHGGKIYAQSESGKGATFVVELPISDH